MRGLAQDYHGFITAMFVFGAATGLTRPNLPRALSQWLSFASQSANDKSASRHKPGIAVQNGILSSNPTSRDFDLLLIIRLSSLCSRFGQATGRRAPRFVFWCPFCSELGILSWKEDNVSELREIELPLRLRQPPTSSAAH